MKEVRKNLYQFSVYIPPMDFTIHQYLLASDPAILFAAGTVQQAEAVLPDVKEILGDRPLKYVFISHMESDEAGGLSVLKAAYPDLQVICGELSAREIPGYGYNGKIIAKRGGQDFNDGELNLHFINYPAEVHLQKGLLCLEKNSGILYSSDLFLQFGNGVGKVQKADWKEKVKEIGADRVPNENLRSELKTDLLRVQPEFAAVGHGFCLEFGA